MAAPCNSDHSPDIPTALKNPKNEASSPESADLSDSNQYHSNPSTPSRFSPLDVTVSGSGSAGRSGSAAASSSGFPTCRGMSWTPSETNALIAVWGNERLNEARIQQLEVAGTVFTGKAPGPAVYERVSKALAELGYERTPSQCRERMKTLRRCYSRVKEHGVGKRKSSYSLEQLEKVFGQGGCDFQPCQPVLINSSGHYQDMESDGSTMEECSQGEWCNRDLAEMETGEWGSLSVQQPRAAGTDDEPEESERRRSGNGYSRRALADRRKTEILPLKKPAQELSQVSSDSTQRQEVMRNVMRILESAQLKWEPFQTWMDFSRLHLSNKLALFAVGYNTRWREEVRYHHAEISSQVPLGKRLREYFNPERLEGRVIMAKVQKMNWKSVFYKFLDITISEARCLELHLEVDWVPVSLSRPLGSGGGPARYLLPEGVPRTHGLYAIGCGEEPARSGSAGERCSSPEPSEPEAGGEADEDPPRVTYRYLGVAEGRTMQQCLHRHFRAPGGRRGRRELSPVSRFLQESRERGPNVYVKFIEVELDFLSAGSLVECLEMAVGYPLTFNRKEDV
ncbi:myb/SANT-like DNA-binding domain-containing protein 2 isoform X1 [Conger conger]|uniref:myb/SANT-like DNA-binding domain-containing protein 2 isoform X1 n=1 Tax=Conger conger TaxID=82655 RepID=UPI002A5AC018|nr:myb/SANT-like DNA-binding domain-containing protein 2 isoform X1 [Conger conger]